MSSDAGVLCELAAADKCGPVCILLPTALPLLLHALAMVCTLLLISVLFVAFAVQHIITIQLKLIVHSK